MYSKDSQAQKYSYIRGQRWKCSWPFELLVSDKVTKLLLHWWPLRLCTYINRGHNLWTQYCRADSVTVAVPLLKCYRKACYYDSKHNIDQIRSHMQTKTKPSHWRPALKMYTAPETNLNKKNLLQLHSLPQSLYTSFWKIYLFLLMRHWKLPLKQREEMSDLKLFSFPEEWVWRQSLLDKLRI